jgi:hypothetical protein
MSNINNSIHYNIIDIANGDNDDNSPTVDAGTFAAINDNDLEVLESGDNGKGYTKRGSGFTKTEDLLVCKAFIAASEDSQCGASQKIAQFKQKMWSCYSTLLEEQERMDCARVNGRLSNGIITVYDRRNGVTLLRRFKDVLSYRCSKFLGVEETTPMESGWNAEKHYKACKHTYENRFPRLGNPDDFHLCYVYLQSKPKWHSYQRSQSILTDKINVRPNGKKKDKTIMNDKAIIKKTLEEMNMTTPVDGNNTLTNYNDNREGFFKNVEDAMVTYVSAMKDRNDHHTLKLLATPEKCKIAQMKADIMMGELELQKAQLELKTRKVLKSISEEDNNYNKSDRTCMTNNNFNGNNININSENSINSDDNSDDDE